ncbi:hypothetical protein [Vibrio phage vB_VhaM_VH-8]|nr:hypothetical protein [Vibrio phage vB_VhaM_VH-8]
MAVITGLLNTEQVVPSDVFGWEVNTDVGYGRETFAITVGTGVRVGTILEVDYAAKTATPLAAPADAAAVDALGELAVFVGRDLPVNPSTLQDFERLSMTENGDGVAITRGDGRGVLKKGYLDLAGTQFYKLPDDVQAALVAKFTTENRFKVLDQQYTPA